MKSSVILHRTGSCILFTALLLVVTQTALSQTPPPAWSFTKYFKFNIENILVNTTAPGAWNVKIIFSVTNPNPGPGVPNNTWNIKSDLPFQSPGGSVTMDIGWDPREFTNTGAVPVAGTPSLVPRLTALDPVVTTSLGTGAAYPIQIRNLVSPVVPPGANACASTAECPGVASLTNRFWIQRSVSPLGFMRAVTAGRVGMEGHPVCNGLPGCPTTIAPFASIPVRSAVADFSFAATATPTSTMIADPRRPIVDFDSKCKVCHNGSTLSGNGTLIPRLSLHGNNRNENLKLCVICHNSDQTDVPFRLLTSDPRTSGPETPVDFKRMVHAIHAGGFRKTPWIIIGFNTSINDYSPVRFPRELRNCLNCHVEVNGKGTFELPLNSAVLGTTVNTRSVYAVPPGSNRTIDVNPFNDLKITPIAAACSGCHDESEVRSHMIQTGGASFSTLQQNIGSTVIERCVGCHGPGKEKDVRRVHEVGTSGTSPDDHEK